MNTTLVCGYTVYRHHMQNQYVSRTVRKCHCKKYGDFCFYSTYFPNQINILRIFADFQQFVKYFIQIQRSLSGTANMKNYFIIFLEKTNFSDVTF